MKIKINKNQQKIIVASSAAAIAIFIFYIFVYVPAKDSMKKISDELESLELQVSSILDTIGRGKQIIERLEKLNKELEYYKAKFPLAEEEVLKNLTDEAGRLGIDIVSIKPSRKERWIDDTKNAPEKLEGYIVNRLPITIQCKGRYQAVGNYLKILNSDFPALVTLETFNLTADRSKLPVINCEMSLSIYLLEKE